MQECSGYDGGGVRICVTAVCWEIRHRDIANLVFRVAVANAQCLFDYATLSPSVAASALNYYYQYPLYPHVY